MGSQPDRTPLIVIVGETASGKSDLAMQLAERFSGEIIAADSWTVYRDFDIGTAKPSAEERARVPHHLLDIADPRKGFSAVEFQKRAFRAIDEISERGNVPILVGGTGLYIDSVIFDYGFLQAPLPGLREQLNALSLPDLLSKADALDLDTTGIDIRNKRRVIRLIENNGAAPTRHDLRGNTLLLGVQVDREHLRERVTKRVDAMFAAGLVDEVRILAERYGWEAEPMKGIGYREFYEYFKDTQTLEQTRERIISATMNLAKRQRTWFKRNNSIQWISQRSAFAESVDFVTTLLHK